MWYVVSTSINQGKPYPFIHTQVDLRTNSRRDAYEAFMRIIAEAELLGYRSYEIWDSDYNVCTCTMRHEAYREESLFNVKMYKDGIY